jgi:uncharacterized protein (TIGR00255 family)
MLISMTGFGRGEATVDGVTATADARSVNSRYLDISLNIPRSMNVQEQAIRDLIKSKAPRGRISVHVSLMRNGNEELGMTIDTAAAKSAFALLEGLRSEIGLKSEIQLSHLLQFSEVMKPAERADTDVQAWEATQQALVQALDSMNSMREQEGRQLLVDVDARITGMEMTVGVVEKLIVSQVDHRRTRLKERIKVLLDGAEMDDQRLALEVAMIADKLDITEECVRFRSHVKFFRELIASNEPAGRKLNFLTQELNREINTMGSKAEDPEIARAVVSMKEELEKIREQIQNIE